MRQTQALLWLLLCCSLALPAAASAEDLYVAGNAAHSISGFQIDDEGLLTPIECAQEAPCASEAGPGTLAVSPNAKYVFLVNRAKETISTLAIGADGTLSKVACAKKCTTASEPAGTATTPNGKYVYVANSGAESITMYSVAAGGALTRVACKEAEQCKTEGRPFGLAVSPGGGFLYATDVSAERVSVFSIAAGGALTRLTTCGASCKTEVEPTGIAIAPNGQFLYVANRGSGTVSAFQIGAGVPSPIACAAASCKTGVEPTGITIAPNGQFLYVSNAGANSISAFQIAPNGALSPLECAAPGCETGAEPVGIAVSPDGRFLYAADARASTISPFSIESQGTLSGLSCTAPNCTTGSAAFFQSLAITPDQAPTASFTDTPVAAGSPSTFNASASTASPGQSVASYDWSFGDGTSVQSTSPTVSHSYAKAATYTATLTVTDSAGCSDQLIFTGQTASCNGSSGAQHTSTVTVPSVSLALKVSLGDLGKLRLSSFDPHGGKGPTPSRVELTLSSLRQSTARWREGKSLAHISSARKAPPVGTRFSFHLSQAASVTLTFLRARPGRRVAGRCVAPSRRNAHAHRCQRSVIAGTLKRAAGAGASTVHFYGLLSKRKRLSPGKYTLVLSATAASGAHATTTALHFTIIRPSG
ncbi:MAG: beta-propeller fold lactonase family protein [Solirubrobacteraceae bacterium]